MFVPSPVHGDIVSEEMSSVPGSSGRFLLFGIQLSANQFRVSFRFAVPLSRQPLAVSNKRTLNRPTGVTDHVPRSLVLVRCVCHPQTKSCFSCAMFGDHLTFNTSQRGCDRVPPAGFHFLFFCRKSCHQRASRSPSGLRQTCTVLTCLCSGDRTCFAKRHLECPGWKAAPTPHSLKPLRQLFGRQEGLASVP